MHDNEARNRTVLSRMAADKSVSIAEWWSLQRAVALLGYDAEQKELDACVLKHEQRDIWFEAHQKWLAEFEREHVLTWRK